MSHGMSPEERARHACDEGALTFEEWRAEIVRIFADLGENWIGYADQMSDADLRDAYNDSLSPQEFVDSELDAAANPLADT